MNEIIESKVPELNITFVKEVKEITPNKNVISTTQTNEIESTTTDEETFTKKPLKKVVFDEKMIKKYVFMYHLFCNSKF